jgi:hypothetical protein
MWPSSEGVAGIGFGCCCRSVRSACRSDLICWISDWISAKTESSLSSLSGLIATTCVPSQCTTDTSLITKSSSGVLYRWAAGQYHRLPEMAAILFVAKRLSSLQILLQLP